MAVKKTGISRDLIIHPGETIAEVLEVQEITQAELAARTGVSAAYVCNVIAGKKDISARFAMGLEYALGVSRSFWLNLQAAYDAELLELNEKQTITAEEIEVCEELKEVIAYLQQGEELPECEEKTELILPLRKLLQVSNLVNLRDVFPGGAFCLQGGKEMNPYVMGAWVRLCQRITAGKEIATRFVTDNVEELVVEIKKLMYGNEENLSEKLVEVMEKHGIVFSVMKRFSGAPVRGYISQRNDGTYQMVLTVEEMLTSTFWFALFHELGHIVNGDIGKTVKFIDDGMDEYKEQRADRFAQEYFALVH